MHAKTERLIWMLIATVAFLMFVATVRTTGNHLSLEKERSAVISLISSHPDGEVSLPGGMAR